jgi:hypothetical protein
MFKKLIFLILLFFLTTQTIQAEKIDKDKMVESCADEIFMNEFGKRVEGYLQISLEDKIKKNEPYKWLYRDCKKKAERKPITFKLKNSLYEEELNEVTSKVFERCADERYVLEFGDIYNQFLDLKIQDKMRQQIEYEWYVEACEDEFRDYPIKFRMKYY